MSALRPAGTVLVFAALGNPGPEYARTRHNAGRFLADFLRTQWKAEAAGKKENCDLWRAEVRRMSVVLAAPRSYMNESGPPVAALVRSLGLPLDQLVVMHDELDLPPGRAQLKRGGAAAGHRGVESIIQELGAAEFYRLRLGIGRPGRGAREYVLSEFPPQELETLNGVFDRLTAGIDDWIMGFVDRGAQKVNTPGALREPEPLRDEVVPREVTGMTIEAGMDAPAFTVMTDEGVTVTLSDYKGKNVVLYFYPKDDTPGCTTEACGFRDQKADFDGRSTVILGVSVDSVASHAKFKAKYKLPFTLLADTDGEICRAYGVLKEGGRTARRATFVIDGAGKIKKVFPQVNVAGHVDEVKASI